MVKRELTHLYQTTLESVVADKAMIERLGEPIETVIEADDLFRRKGKGPVNPAGEHIEFEGAIGAEITVIHVQKLRTSGSVRNARGCPVHADESLAVPAEKQVVETGLEREKFFASLGIEHLASARQAVSIGTERDECGRLVLSLLVNRNGENCVAGLRVPNPDAEVFGDAGQPSFQATPLAPAPAE